MQPDRVLQPLGPNLSFATKSHPIRKRTIDPVIYGSHRQKMLTMATEGLTDHRHETACLLDRAANVARIAQPIDARFLFSRSG